MKAIIPAGLRPALIVLFLIMIVSAGVWLFLRYKPFTEKSPNVILISIDTCRADYLSCYGYPRQTTPNIDQVSKEGILFENVYSPIPLTLPGHASMLTGTIPPFHGVHENLDYRLPQSNVTLAELLDKNDFTTGAIVSSFVLDSQFGLNQGFTYYNDRFEDPLKHAESNVRRGGEASRFAMEWLEKNKNERFFLFLHYYDPHYEYDPPEPFASDFHDNLYAGEIAYTDHCIGQVIKKLKELDLYESALIIITSDHGEMLGEHGEETHTYFIYQSALKVPLIIKLPGSHKARRISDPVGIVDIVPTICSVQGIETQPHVQGLDLSPYFEGKQPAFNDRHLYCESLMPTKFDANSLLGMVNSRWKYIQTTRPELYDIVKDPAETNNLVNQEPNRARILQDHLKQVLEDSVRKGDSDSKIVLDEEGRKRLESLGYLASTSVSEEFDFDQSKEDPKDLIGFYNLDQQASKLINQEEHTEAKIICEKMLRIRPGFFRTYSHLAKIARAQDDYEGIVSSMTEIVRLKPDDADAHSNLGAALASRGRLDEAISHYSEALRINPGHAGTHSNLGSVLVLKGRPAEAIDHYQEAIRINPRYVKAHCNLGSALVSLGRLDEAIKHYNEALSIKPRDTKTHCNLGSVLVSLGRLDEAIKHYNEALRIDPMNAKAHCNLGSTLASQGRLDEAIMHYNEALRIDPDYAKAHNFLGYVLAFQGRLDEAINHYNAALRIDPGLTAARRNLNTAMEKKADP